MARMALSPSSLTFTMQRCEPELVTPTKPTPHELKQLSDLECTGEGVIFIEADADVTLEQFGDALYPPIPCMDKLLYDVPGSGEILHRPLLLIQLLISLSLSLSLSLKFSFHILLSWGSHN
ncbi:benzyl alcohol o-benzoyltransferase [Quercus suber]|uniref:Benzyl alcohol o-benzoyltransferase n=1 Tax=Quercus suber TaxID=58331 RepID=A0AAW0JZ64_QUESU